MRQLIIGLYAVISITVAANCRIDSNEVDIRPTPSVTVSVVPEIGVTVTATTPPKSEEVQITLTPSPEPSPTPTVTPVVYTVAAGDTLYDIAASYGINVEEILNLNIDLRPELLQIGQQIILPPLPTDEPSPEPNTVGPLGIEIRGLSIYPSATGGLWILGEVKNSGVQAVENIKVELTLRDSSGKALIVQEVWVTPGVVDAAMIAPFGKLLSHGSAEMMPEASVVLGNFVNDLGNRYIGLAVVDSSVTIDTGSNKLRGRVENIGQETVSRLLLVAIYYDDQRNVTGYSELWMESSLSPGSSLPFEIVLLPPGEQVSDYAFSVMGLKN